MQVLRKNYPIIIAWLAYLASAWLLKLLFTLGASWVYLQLAVASSLPILGIIIFVIAEYIGFVVSVRWIAVPISRSAHTISAKPTPSFLLLDWLSYGFFFVVFCFPLFLINAFPGFTLTGVSYLIPISTETARLLGFAWKFIVSFFVYRSTILSYFREESKRSSPNEFQSSVS